MQSRPLWCRGMGMLGQGVGCWGGAWVEDQEEAACIFNAIWNMANKLQSHTESTALLAAAMQYPERFPHPLPLSLYLEMHFFLPNKLLLLILFFLLSFCPPSPHCSALPSLCCLSPSVSPSVSSSPTSPPTLSPSHTCLFPHPRLFHFPLLPFIVSLPPSVSFWLAAEALLPPSPPRLPSSALFSFLLLLVSPAFCRLSSLPSHNFSGSPALPIVFPSPHFGCVALFLQPT